MRYKKILVALAGEEEEKKVIREAFRLNEQLNTSMRFLTVNNPRAGKPHLMMDTIKPVREEDIRVLIEKAGFAEESNRAEVTIVHHDAYEKEIAQWAKDIDMLVMGHNKTNAFMEALITAMGQKVANIVDCPILIVPKG